MKGREIIKRFLNESSGMELSEYAVASAIVVAGILAAIAILSDTITGIIQGLSDLIGALIP